MSVKIKPIGKYLETNKDGYLIPLASLNKIQPKWRKVVDKATEAYQKQFGDRLVSVYVRGSVAKGEAIDNISDIDTIAIVSEKLESDDRWTRGISERLILSFPFTTGVEFYTITQEQLDQSESMKFTIKVESVCVFGKDVSQKIPPYDINNAIAFNLKNLDKNLKVAKDVLDKNESPEAIKEICGWICRRMLRGGFQLVIGKEKKFTRALYFSYKSFSKYYPNKEPLAHQVLEYAIEPTDNIEKIEKLMTDFGWWLIEEYNKNNK